MYLCMSYVCVYVCFNLLPTYIEYIYFNYIHTYIKLIN